MYCRINTPALNSYKPVGTGSFLGLLSFSFFLHLPYNFKKLTNKQINKSQKQINKCREQPGACQKGGDWGDGEKR